MSEIALPKPKRGRPKKRADTTPETISLQVTSLENSAPTTKPAVEVVKTVTQAKKQIKPKTTSNEDYVKRPVQISVETAKWWAKMTYPRPISNLFNRAAHAYDHYIARHPNLKIFWLYDNTFVVTDEPTP